MKMINCTPHNINVVKGSEVITIEPSGIIPRVEMETKTSSPIDGFEVETLETKGVEGLPAPKEDTVYICSAMVAQAAKRGDVIAPNTNKAERNEKGHIISVPGFVRY